MSKATEIINKLASSEQSGWLEDAKWRSENRDWLDKSFKLAVKILREIRRQKPLNGMTQRKLAEEMGVSPQYINKIVKGKENLTLETISKIEAVLGVSLFEVPSNTVYLPFERAQEYSSPLNRFKAKKIGNYSAFWGEEETCLAEPDDDYLPNGTHGY
ncbi:MAG: helix-turn-helix transcriptional regulator [Salinivirgaceae bacterium]